MLEVLLYVAIGAAIGWTVPQPLWATFLLAKVKGWFGR